MTHDVIIVVVHWRQCAALDTEKRCSHRRRRRRRRRPRRRPRRRCAHGAVVFDAPRAHPRRRDVTVDVAAARSPRHRSMR